MGKLKSPEMEIEGYYYDQENNVYLKKRDMVDMNMDLIQTEKKLKPASLPTNTQTLIIKPPEDQGETTLKKPTFMHHLPFSFFENKRILESVLTPEGSIHYLALGTEENTLKLGKCNKQGNFMEQSLFTRKSSFKAQASFSEQAQAFIVIMNYEEFYAISLTGSVLKKMVDNGLLLRL